VLQDAQGHVRVASLGWDQLGCVIGSELRQEEEVGGGGGLAEELDALADERGNGKQFFGRGVEAGLLQEGPNARAELLDRQGSATSANTALVDLHDEFAAYLERHIVERQNSANPPDDIITRFTRAEVEGARLTVRAIQTQMMFFIIAGNGTTRDLIGNLLLRLTSDEAVFQSIRQDRSLIPALVEEVLRLDSPVQLLARNCRVETILDGTTVRPGERVLLSIASANRDETIWPDAGAFLPGRERGRAHLAFGAGPHICPAAALARMEACLATVALLDRIDRLAFSPDYMLDLNPVVWANGPQTLRVKLSTKSI